jgi:hypothetical protein
MKRQAVPTLRQHKLEPDREHLCYSHVLVRKPAVTRRRFLDANPPLHRVLSWNACDIYSAPLCTRHGLAKSDLEYDLLAGSQLISLEKQSGDGECRIGAQEGLDVLSGVESNLTSSHAAR